MVSFRVAHQFASEDALTGEIFSTERERACRVVRHHYLVQPSSSN